MPPEELEPLDDIFNTDQSRSEWNEQMIFARMFFMLSDGCRNAQISGNVFEWKQRLDAKISHVHGILEAKEDEIIEEKRKGVGGLMREAMEVSNSMNDHNTEQKKRYDRKMSYLAEALYDLEKTLDKAVNSKMPFLKLKQEIDITKL